MENLPLKQQSAGFTLIELLFVVAIVGILSAVGSYGYAHIMERLAYNQAITDIAKIELLITAYYTRNNGLPASLGEINAPLDPWGNPYQYLNISLASGTGQQRKDHNLVPINTDYDLYSMGPDGQSASPLTAKQSHDDVIRANNGGYVGKASEY